MKRISFVSPSTCQAVLPVGKKSSSSHVSESTRRSSIRAGRHIPDSQPQPPRREKQAVYLEKGARAQLGFRRHSRWRRRQGAILGRKRKRNRELFRIRPFFRGASRSQARPGNRVRPHIVARSPERIHELGGKPVVSRVGYTYLYDKMVSERALFGAEASGHVYFRVTDSFYTESATYAIILLLKVLARTKKNSPSSLPSQSEILSGPRKLTGRSRTREPR